MYEVTRTFTSGLLEGLTITQTFNSPQPVGFRCDKPYGNTSGYVIVSCVKIS